MRHSIMHLHAELVSGGGCVEQSGQQLGLLGVKLAARRHPAPDVAELAQLGFGAIAVSAKVFGGRVIAHHADGYDLAVFDGDPAAAGAFVKVAGDVQGEFVKDLSGLGGVEVHDGSLCVRAGVHVAFDLLSGVEIVLRGVKIVIDPIKLIARIPAAVHCLVFASLGEGSGDDRYKLVGLVVYDMQFHFLSFSVGRSLLLTI
jgi:hypothetical protein